jgi:hypothetical protein
MTDYIDAAIDAYLLSDPDRRFPVFRDSLCAAIAAADKARGITWPAVEAGGGGGSGSTTVGLKTSDRSHFCDGGGGPMRRQKTIAVPYNSRYGWPGAPSGPMQQPVTATNPEADPMAMPIAHDSDGPRFGGDNGGPLVADVTDPLEREIREAFDHFDNVFLRGHENWLNRQRTGRLCEDIVRIVQRAREP